MFGIGLPELILIMAVALIVVGPEKLPEIAKSVAKGIIELKKAAYSLKDSLQDDEAQPWNELKPDNKTELFDAYKQLPIGATETNGPLEGVEFEGVNPQAGASDLREEAPSVDPEPANHPLLEDDDRTT